MSRLHRISLWHYILIGALMIAVFAMILFVMGQPLICKCGYVKLWHGVTVSSENSQHISDWYTFSHVIHGFGFYFILWFISRYREKRGKGGLPLGLMFVLAVIAETAWEIFENTDFIINRYRETTISLDYFGDSVLNSTNDVLFMVLGFILARKLPVWAVIALTIAMEVFVGYMIRDNLTLNIIMLIYPFESVLRWQQGG